MRPNSTVKIEVRLRNTEDYGNSGIEDIKVTKFILDARPCIEGEAYKNNL